MRSLYLRFHAWFVMHALAFGHCLHGIDRLTDVCDRCNERPFFWSREHWYQAVKWWPRQYYRVALMMRSDYYACFTVPGQIYPVVRFVVNIANEIQYRRFSKA